ncbi:MAG: hypothetical protein ABFD89_01670 [Bryobacteraceae bacterium]
MNYPRLITQGPAVLPAPYLGAAIPGRIFFAEHLGFFGKVNKWYQRWRRDADGALPPFPESGFIPTHVGIIGAGRTALESTMFSGPTVGSLDRYLCPHYRLAIGRPVYWHSKEDVERALLRLAEKIRNYDCKYGYDWVSLLTCGLIQKNNAQICSELVTHFMNELLRENREWNLVDDEFVLPIDWLRVSSLTWRSWSN